MAEPTAPVVGGNSHASVVTPAPETPQRKASSFREAMEAKRNMPPPPLNGARGNVPANSAPLSEAPRNAAGHPTHVRGAVDATRPQGEGSEQDPLLMAEPVATPAEADEPAPEGDEAAAQPEYVKTLEEAAAAYEALRSGDELPEDFHDKLVTVKHNGREFLVPVKEAAEGYQRMRDYSQGMGELKQAREQLQTATAAVENQKRMIGAFSRDILNPDTVFAAFQKIGAANIFHKAAEKYAAELKHYARTQGNGTYKPLIEQWERDAVAKDAARKDAEIRELRARLEAPPQQYQQQQELEHMQRQLEQLRPRAFARHGLPLANEPGGAWVDQVFHAHLVQLAQDEKITPQLVEAATRATKESWDDERGTSKNEVTAAQRARMQKAQPGGIQRQGVAPGAKAPRDQPATIQNFREKIASLNGGRSPWGG